ncbi:oxidative stress survival, Svf1-like protein [Morchella snyderi]|nr:oxidative stress survival, Svf1-like protein [Morchella snyderi]
MFSWVKSTAQASISAALGTAEPIYGPSAIQSVALQESENPTYEITRDDLRWHGLDTTSAETQTFYLEAESGHMGLVQIIYSNVANIHVTAQVSTKIFHPDGRITWSSKPLTSTDFFDDTKHSFYADNIAVILSDDGKSYTIKSAVDPAIFIDLVVTQTTPGFKIGKDGRTNFGIDPENPWGAIRHVFLPRNTLEGFIKVGDEKINFKGKAMYVMALQGMKPHHAAAKWNFVNFQGPTYSAIMMEFTTPASYGSTTVNIIGISKDGELVAAGTKGECEHLASQLDDVELPEPTAVKFVWNATTKDGKAVEAVLEEELGKKIDRVDIMAEVPAIIKKIAGNVAGTKPYMYQYRKKTTMEIKIGDEIIEEEGKLFYEATFISEL